MDRDIAVETKGGIATVTFNRPEQRNAIDYKGWHELRRIMGELGQDDEVKVAVLTGEGDEAFSAGADIKDFERYRNNSAIAKKYAAAFEALWTP